MSMALRGQLPPEHNYNQQEAANFNLIAEDLKIKPVDENIQNAVKINLNGQIAYYDRGSLETINKHMELLRARNITDLTQLQGALLPGGIATIIAGYMPDGFQAAERRPDYPENTDSDTEEKTKADAGSGTAAADAKAVASAKDQGAKEASAAGVQAGEEPPNYPSFLDSDDEDEREARAEEIAKAATSAKNRGASEVTADAVPAEAPARVSTWAAGAPLFEDYPTFQELDEIEVMYRVVSGGGGGKGIEITRALTNLASRLGIPENEIKAADNLFTLIRSEMARALIAFCKALSDPGTSERTYPNQFSKLLTSEYQLMSSEEAIRQAREIDQKIRSMRSIGPGNEDWRVLHGERFRGVDARHIPSAIIQYLNNILSDNDTLLVSFDMTPGIVDFSPLRHLVNVRKLILIRCQIADVTMLKGLEELRWLDLRENVIEDITALAQLATLSRLGHLNVSSNRIVDVSPIARMPILEFVDISSNQVRDLSPFANHKILRELSIANNPIISLQPLFALRKLERLVISEDQQKRFELELKELRAKRPNLHIEVVKKSEPDQKLGMS